MNLRKILYAISSPNFTTEIKFRTLSRFYTKTPVYIISYPRSGRTWLKSLIGRYITKSNNLPESLVFKTTKITKETGLHPTLFTHDRSTFWGPDYKKMKKSKEEYKKTKVIFLIRDPRDTLVSYYFHQHNRYKRYIGTISEFIKSQNLPLHKLLQFYNIWWDNKKTPIDFLIIRYEDLKKEPEKVLHAILKYLGVKSIDDSLLNEAIEYSSFENMKKRETQNRLHNKIKNVENSESMHVRSGKTGNYGEYFTEEDIKYINEVFKEIGCPFYK